MKQDRINEIEQYIFSVNVSSKDHLCEKFGISKATLRRDLDELEKRGSIVKVYGGVRANQLIPLHVKNTQHTVEKTHIGKLAAQFVQDSDTIFIDSSSTTVQMIKHIAQKRDITVVTHSLAVMQETAKYENLKMISLGGYYSAPTQSFVGATTLQNLNAMHISKAFMSTSGLTTEHGMMNATLFETEIKRGIVAHIETIYLLADHTKFGKKAIFSVCPLDRLNTVITDQQPDQQFCDYFEKSNVNLVY